MVCQVQRETEQARVEVAKRVVVQGLYQSVYANLVECEAAGSRFKLGAGDEVWCGFQRRQVWGGRRKEGAFEAGHSGEYEETALVAKSSNQKLSYSTGFYLRYCAL